MIDQAYTYIGAALEKIKDISPPIRLHDLTSRAGNDLKFICNVVSVIARFFSKNKHPLITKSPRERSITGFHINVNN